MNPSVKAYNASPTAIATGIILNGSATNYRSCSVNSNHNPAMPFHYEIFFEPRNGKMFACIHSSHTNGEPLHGIISGFINPLLAKLNANPAFSQYHFTNTQQDIGMGTGHIINIQIPRGFSTTSANNNAMVMEEIVKFTNGRI